MKGVLLNSLRLFVALMMMGTFFVSFATMGMVASYKSLEYTKIYSHKGWCWYPKLVKLTGGQLDDKDKKFLGMEVENGGNT